MLRIEAISFFVIKKDTADSLTLLVIECIEITKIEIPNKKLRKINFEVYSVILLLEASSQNLP